MCGAVNVQLYTQYTSDSGLQLHGSDTICSTETGYDIYVRPDFSFSLNHLHKSSEKTFVR